MELPFQIAERISKIFIEIDIEKRRGDAALYVEKVKEEALAAFSKKIQSKEFDREQLEAFVGDEKRRNFW